MEASSVVEDFMRHHQRKHTQDTFDFYRKGLKWFSGAFAGQDWNAIDRHMVLDALDAANRRPDGEPWSNATITRNNRAFDQLQRYALEAFKELDPILRPRDFEMPAIEQRDTIPTPEELAEFCERAGSPRSRAAFTALAQSGMRPKDLCRSMIEFLNPEQDCITLKKHKTARRTGKPKRIPLGDILRGLVEESIAGRDSGPIWRNDRGEAWTPDALGKRFRAIRDKANLNPVLVLYSLRHYKGTTVARENGILAVKEVLGHARISTSERYIHLSEEDARKYQDGGNRR